MIHNQPGIGGDMGEALSDAQGVGRSARREILRAAALSAGAALTFGLVGARADAAITPPLNYGKIPEPKYLNLPFLPGGNDIKVLNYALTLEDLESDLYVQALMRQTIGGTNALGKQIPGLGLSMKEPDVFFTSEFGAVEAEHRDFIRGSLNGLIAGIAQRPFKYDFGIESMSRAQVLDMLITVEYTGLSAYLGAVPYLKTRAFIVAAASIQGTEARHTSVLTAVQNVLFAAPGTARPVAPLASDNNGIDKPIDPNTVLAAVSPYIVA